MFSPLRSLASSLSIQSSQKKPDSLSDKLKNKESTNDKNDSYYYLQKQELDQLEEELKYHLHTDSASSSGSSSTYLTPRSASSFSQILSADSLSYMSNPEESLKIPLKNNISQEEPTTTFFERLFNFTISSLPMPGAELVPINFTHNSKPGQVMKGCIEVGAKLFGVFISVSIFLIFYVTVFYPLSFLSCMESPIGKNIGVGLHFFVKSVVCVAVIPMIFIGSILGGIVGFFGASGRALHII